MVTAQSAGSEETCFTWSSGDIALDFAGTLRKRRSIRDELLRRPDDLARWLVSGGILDEKPVVAEAAFASAIELREAVHELAAARLAGAVFPSGALALVNERARRPQAAPRLDRGGALHREGGVDEALATIARHAVLLLGSDAVLRRCGAEDCTRIFVDRSRRGDRKWCDMAVCGNRVKARAHRRRRATLWRGSGERAVGLAPVSDASQNARATEG